jgi:hypothetical protein
MTVPRLRTALRSAPFALLVSCSTPAVAPQKTASEPEAFVEKIESFVATYLEEGVDLSSAGLSTLCAQGKESCRSERADLHKRCTEACERYWRAAQSTSSR